MSHYAVGTRFEHKVRDELAANGYDVIRAAGSKGSTKVDLAAFKPGQLLLVQCKLDGVIGPAEWDRLVEVAAWVSAVPVLAQNGHRGRGVIYTRLLGPKRRGAQMHRQPCAPFRLDELARPTMHSAFLDASDLNHDGLETAPRSPESQDPAPPAIRDTLNLIGGL